MSDPTAEPGKDTRIEADPESEDDEMDVDEGHAPREARDRLGDAILPAGLPLFRFPPGLQRIDIAIED